jgi:membrane protein implicated in regulation of membrane protease activity
VLTIAAAVFLGFDGAVLVVGGLWAHQFVLAIVGACFCVAAGLLAVYWRWHQKQLREIAEARRQVQQEARALRDLIQGN